MYLCVPLAHLATPQGHGEHDRSLLWMPKQTIQSEWHMYIIVYK